MVFSSLVAEIMLRGHCFSGSVVWALGFEQLEKYTKQSCYTEKVSQFLQNNDFFRDIL